MSVPLFPEKIGRPGVLSPQRMVEFRRAHGALRGVAPTSDAVVSLYSGVMRRLSWRHRLSRVRGFAGDLYVVRRSPRRVGVIGNVGIGGPAIVNLAEELIAWGTERIVALSLAGGLSTELPPGSVVVCDRAIRDEGTSHHYLAPARDVRAADDLVALLSRGLGARGVASYVGATWSTDAAYRETRLEIEALGSEGVLTVDMESAGLFAAARVRGARAASVLVVGDRYGDEGWIAPADMADLHGRMRMVLEAIIASLAAT
ncbi:MAG: hypothetical protein KGK34_07780 [Chloroflexota bacterium]|nr:hypothetical protein [Chloroflexota bacterium]